MIPSAGQMRFAVKVGLPAITMAIGQGCMRSLEVPHANLESPNAWSGYYRIETNATHFMVHDFATTDSTLVITRLSGDDRHFGRIQMPVITPIVEVRNVSRQEVNVPKTFLIVGGSLAAVVGLLAWLFIAGESNEY